MPPLSQLKTASGVDDQPEAWQGQEDSPHYQDLTPVRYWTFPIILLLFLYAGLLLVRIPIALQSGIFIALMQTGFATVAIVFGILIFRFAVPKQ